MNTYSQALKWRNVHPTVTKVVQAPAGLFILLNSGYVTQRQKLITHCAKKDAVR